MPDPSTLRRAQNSLLRAFVNAEERRLRAGWRLLCYGILFIVGMSSGELVLAAMFAVGGSKDLPPEASQVLHYVVYLAVTLSCTWLARRVLDRRPFLDIGLRLSRRWWADALFGVSLGGALMACIAFVEWAAGWLQFRGFAWQDLNWAQLLSSFAMALVVYVAVAINEELMIRGYVMQNLGEGLNMTWALLISSALFGLLHLGNPYASWVSTLNIAFAGVFLATSYLVNRTLWLPMGLHLGWNFFQGTIFGFPVSGVEGFHLVRQTVAGPEWATGGPFGPEAGLTGLAAMALGTSLISHWAMVRRRRQGADQSVGRGSS